MPEDTPEEKWLAKPTPRWFAILTTLLLLVFAGSEVILHIKDTGINSRLLNLEEAKSLPERIFIYDPLEKTVEVDELFTSDVVFEYKGYNTVYYCLEWEVTNDKGNKDFITPMEFSTKNPRCSWISADKPKTSSKEFKFAKEGKYKIKAYVYYNKDIEGEEDDDKYDYLKKSVELAGDIAGKYETKIYYVKVLPKEEKQNKKEVKSSEP